MTTKTFETLTENGGSPQNTSVGTNAIDIRFPSRRKIGAIYGFALLLALALFYFQVVVIFDVVKEILRSRASLLEKLRPNDAAKIIVLGCFFALMLTHMIQALIWGLFLRCTKLLSSITEAVYYTAASITTLGFGDILLKYPWRHLGTLMAVTGVLMFGCSTAFLFVILQEAWRYF